MSQNEFWLVLIVSAVAGLCGGGILVWFINMWLTMPVP